VIYKWLADGLVTLHAAFVAFVVLGGLAAMRWPRVAWIHIPAAIWGALIEFAGWICPLTPLENEWRMRAGERGYTGGFIDHYVVGALYPAGLTRQTQWLLGACVVAVNVTAYWNVYRRWRRARNVGPGFNPPG
jgi:hypothetical protein